jgi:hypothetical protein
MKITIGKREMKLELVDEHSSIVLEIEDEYGARSALFSVRDDGRTVVWNGHNHEAVRLSACFYGRQLSPLPNQPYEVP